VAPRSSGLTSSRPPMLGTRVIFNSGKGVDVAVGSGVLVAVAVTVAVGGTEVSVGVAGGFGVGGTVTGVVSGSGVQNGRWPQAAAAAPAAVAAVNFKKSRRENLGISGEFGIVTA